MARLSLSVLGSLQISLDRQPVTGFESNKVRALLVYLMIEADRPHSRDELIGLLWPDRSESAARSNLSQALANLRKVLGDTSAQSSFLHITRDTIQMKRDSDYELDAASFQALMAVCRQHAHRRLETCRSCADRLRQAVELYRGDFLEHFYVSAGEAFGEWAAIQRERLHQEALDAWYQLTRHFEWRGDYAQALRYAQRQLEIDPWREEAHQQIMRAFALTGQRSAALAQYATCRRALGQELGAEPTVETTALFEQIRSGVFTSNIQQRPWLTPTTPLIGRESELAEANAIWHKAQSGEGQVLLIGGEPGVGKTRLIHELIAQERYGSALVLLGECYAEGSAPYAPIVQVIQTVLDPSGFQYPKGLAPAIVADLITFMPALQDRFPDVQPNLPLEPQAEQQRRFNSVASFFSTLAAHEPVLIIIEDAHWADIASLALLRHIARRLRRAKALIVATHRAVGLDETRHIHEWLDDLQHERLATAINLTRLDKDNTRDLLAEIFKESITPEFLDGIYNATEGNPFFVTEVCQALIDEGAVYRQGEGWQRLSMAQIQIPQSVRLAIRRRVDRLPQATQDSLQRAAVLGREFEFEVLHAMSDLSEDALIDALELAQRAQLIDEVPRASRAARLSFAFVHALIPTTLHEGLNSLRSQRLHQRAAQALEQVYANRVDELASQLGRHYAEAGKSEKAITYWLKAGELARSVYAYDEAIGHYRQALAFLKDSGPGELARAARTAMTLGGLYHTVFNYEGAQQAYDGAFDLWQQEEAAQRVVTLPPAPHALRCYWPDLQTLDPVANNYTVGEITHQLFCGLVQIGADLDITPSLAHHWEILDDGQRYVFHLRHDARWSDGQPVTARDFECAWRRLLASARHLPHRQYLYSIKNARAISHDAAPLESLGLHVLDDFTLVIDLEEPTSYFLQLLTNSLMFAIPCHVVEAYGATWHEAEHIVANGPFCVSEWSRGDKLVLMRNPNYHGQFSGNVMRVELTLVTWGKNSLDQYDAGEHDVEVILDEGMLIQARQHHADEYAHVLHANTNSIGFDVTRPPFDDVRVRQAFIHSIDRKTLAEVIQFGFATPALGGFVPPGLPGHLPSIGLAYDPQRARRLLAEAGYPQGRSFPAIEAWTVFEANDIWNYLETQWREQLGIEVVWQRLEENDYSQRLIAHTPHLFTIGWLADYPDPDNFLRIGLRLPYLHRWHNAQYDQLLETARRLSDSVERLKFYQAADQLLIQDAGIMPLTYGLTHSLIKPWVKEYPTSALRTTFWKDVIIEPH